jgi:hypothetical protein
VITRNFPSTLGKTRTLKSIAVGLPSKTRKIAQNQEAYAKSLLVYDIADINID